jgi:hypothetical protein
MNSKQLLTVLVIVIVVGAASLLVYNKRMEGRRSGNVALGQKLLGDLPVNDITRISIQQGTNEVNLEKKDDLWRVRERGGYPAAFGEISSFLLKAREVKVMESEEVGPSQLARLSLAPGQNTNSPVVVEFIGQGDKPVQSLLLGKKHMKKSSRPSPMGDMDGSWPDGRYVKLGDKSQKVALISEPFENIEPEPERWLNKDFLRVEKPRSVAVQYPVASNSWKLVRETENGDWTLTDAKEGEQLDRSKASSVSYPLSSASFNDVLAGVNPDQLGLGQPTVLTIETFDNFTYTLKAGQKTNDNYPVTIQVSAQLPKERTAGNEEKPEDKARLDKEFQESQKKLQEKFNKEKALENWIYEVSGWTLDSLLKERSQLMVDKKGETADHGHDHSDDEEPHQDGQAAEVNPTAIPGVP